VVRKTEARRNVRAPGKNTEDELKCLTACPAYKNKKFSIKRHGQSKMQNDSYNSISNRNGRGASRKSRRNLRSKNGEKLVIITWGGGGGGGTMNDKETNGLRHVRPFCSGAGGQYRSLRILIKKRLVHLRGHGLRSASKQEN